ncbi:MAG: (d)CMP kinase [Paracoccaceae bacterium]
MIFTVAIDGPAAAGKGTVARAVADALGFAHLDTGLLYRATGRRVLAGAQAVEAARTLTPDDLAAPDLRRPEVAQAASRVAVDPQVRAALLAFQRDFARREGGAVLDGRDIGTVVCPQAEAKLFVTADAPTRAHRRWLELGGAAHSQPFEEVLEEVRERDARDAARDVAPMVAAPDALTLDTSAMDVDAAVAAALAEVRARMPAG